MYPLANWNNLKKGFSFGQKYPSTAYWRAKGLAGKPHIGLDIILPIGTPIYAPSSGSAKQLGSANGQLGYYVVFTADHDHSVHRMGHLNSYGALGSVNEGDIIGYSGNTGASSAPHVHLDIKVNGKYIDPVSYNYLGVSQDMITRLYKLERDHDFEGDLKKGAVVLAVSSHLIHIGNEPALDMLYEGYGKLNPDVPDYIYSRPRKQYFYGEHGNLKLIDVS